MANDHHTLLLVESPQISADFYQQIGFTLDYIGGPVAILHRGGCEIHCLDKTAARPEFKVDANNEKKCGGTYLFLKTDTIDEVYQKAVGQKLNVGQPPQDWPWGNREFSMTDPDGYSIVLFQKLA